MIPGINLVSIEQLLPGLALVGDFLIALYVLFRNVRNIVNRSFFIFVLGSTLWGFGVIMMLTTKLFFFDKVILYGGMIQILGLVLLSKTFPNTPKLDRAFLPWLIPILIVCILIPFNIFIAGVRIMPNGTPSPINGPGIPFLVLVVGAYIVASIYFFIKRYRALTGIPRLQMQYLFLGAAIFIAGEFIFNVLLPSLGVSGFNFLGLLFSLVFVGSTGYAMVRHQLLDIRVVIQRGVVYMAMLGVIIALYLAIVFGIGYLFHRTTGTAVFMSAILTACIAIIGAPFVERYFRKLTDTIFFRDKYEYSRALQELSEVLNAYVTQEEITREASRVLKKIFKAIKVEIIFEVVHEVKDENLGPVSNAEGSAIEMPLLINKERIGRIFVGSKLSGEAYTREDLSLLQTFSYQAAIALEKARLYDEVEKYSKDLERRVEERTGKLRLLQEEQKRMMVDIAHGLQTPLTGMKIALDMVNKKRLANEKTFHSLGQSVDEVSKLVYNFLDLARLEMMEGSVSKEKIDLSALLKELVEYYRTLGEGRDIKIKDSITSNIYVEGDSKKIKELITNLVSNSFKYMSENSRKEVSLTLIKKGNNAEITVKDSGRGISKKDLPHIFKPFYRTKESERSGARGIGLGLAIAKQIVLRHGGTIQMKSVRNRGATCVVELPLKSLTPF